MYKKLCVEFYDNDKPFADQQEVELYAELLNKDWNILEAMCGSGRLMIPLLKAGFHIEGFDSSSDMLSSLERRLKENNLQASFHFSKAENFHSEKKYDCIIVALGSIQLIQERNDTIKVLENFYSLLAEGGKLIIDLFIPWEALYEHGEISYQEKEITSKNGNVLKLKIHNNANKFKQYYLSEINYEKFSNGKLIESESENFKINWYYNYEFELMLDKIGFKNIEIHNRFMNMSNHNTFIASK